MCGSVFPGRADGDAIIGMEGRSMVSGAKKNLFKAFIAAIIAVLAALTLLLTLFSYARANAGVSAEAADYQWSPSVRMRISEGTDPNVNFTVINGPIAVYSDTEIDFFVRVSSEIANGSTFKYCKSTRQLNTDAEKAAATWITIDKNNRYEAVEDTESVVYYWMDSDANSNFTGYVYFRREYSSTTSEGGQVTNVIEYFPTYRNLIYTVSTADYAPEITGVTARMAGGTVYDGRWLASNLTFEITTGLMEGGQAFDAGKELLSYSIDDGKNFIPIANGNTVEVKDRALDGKVLVFRVTNISGTVEALWKYGEHEGEYPVRMDPYRPEFSVSAETTDLTGNRIEYVNGSWTSRAVSFTLQDISGCCSAITYSVSVGGGDYAEAVGSTTFSSTVGSVKFRATNQAGTVYEYGTAFNVNIDSATPNVNLSAATTDPDDDSRKKTLTSSTDANGTVSFGYANGDIEVYVYNRNASGVAINNASGTVFQYQEKVDGIYTGSWRNMTAQVRSSTGETGYVLTASTRDIISVTRTFKFRIVSNAGLASDEEEATFTLIKSAYLIELGDITAEMNALGWIADKAVVRVSVPTDSKRGTDGTYSVPTVTYDFYYQATNAVGEASRARGRAVEFHEEKESEVRWWYEFDLVASADSTFTVYAKNAAGKNSANTETTDDKIRIDVLDPVYSLSGYIHPTEDIPKEDYIYLDVENPGWVNGQIVLVLRVREGVSGNYVKEMIYATENGEILRDEHTGEIVWQPRNQQMDVSESVLERDENGIEWQWQVYRITIDIKDELEEGERVYIGSRQYKWRVYTNSGKYADVDFTANIDTSDVVAISDFTANSGNKEENVVISGASGQRYVDMSDYGFSVCENTEFSFASSIDRNGVEDHYIIKYQFFNGDGMTGEELLSYAGRLTEAYFVTIAAGVKLPVVIQSDAVGDIYVAIFIESTARAYDGKTVGAGPYVVKLHYDTKNLVITYELQADDNGADVTEDMQAGEWVKGRIFVNVQVKTDDAGGVKIDSSYTFYYMRLASVTGGIPDNGWILVDNGLLTENTDSYSYEFTLPFIDEGFSGYIAVSVCNGAGYRSKQEAASVVLIRIDNTTPDIDEAIVYSREPSADFAEGIRADESRITVGSVEVDVLTYYSTEEISLRRVIDDSRSTIGFYYLPLGAEVSSLNYIKSDFTLLGNSSVGLFGAAGITLSKNTYSTVYYALFAKNEVGTEALGATEMTGGNITLSRVYRFVCDPGTVEGTMRYDEQNGIYSEQTGMFTYLWKNSINIFLTGTGSVAPIHEESYILFQFSVDNGATWFDYLDYGATKWYYSGEDATLAFSPSLFGNYVDAEGNRPFENGVNGVFTFRARNKAGATKVYGNAYIAMEDTVPEFEVITLDSDNLTYYGGEADLTKDPIKWSGGPITIQINTLVMPASGITYMYYLEYNDGSSIISTAEEGSFGKKLTNNRIFSTDTLDGFNLNRDAVLTVTAIGNSTNALYSQIKVRLAVDQVVPEFTLTGQAYRQNSSITELVTSGQWTNRDTVSVSKSAIAQNVSEVEYWYTVKNKDSTAAESAPTRWGDSVGSIEKSESCVITVTATSKAGLSYVREFVINIDTTPPVIRFDGGMNVIAGEEYFIDLRVYVEEANIEICEYITIKEESRGFAFTPGGYILSTSSVDNSTRYEKTTGNPYRGYVKVYVKDYAGNEASIDFYVLPFRLTVNNLTLTDEDLAQVTAYEDALAKARGYMETSRVSYFENLISRLRDRENTLRKEISGYQDYLEKLYNRTSFELRSDYAEMYEYMETFNDYKTYGKEWIQSAITGDSTSKYYAYYQNFLTVFGQLEALMGEVERTEDNVIALPAINMVEREDYEDILRVYDQYRNLTMDQKACFTSNLYNKLMDLKESCEVLLLVDEELGVAIDGDFAPGATINVTVYGSTTGTFTNAQSLLAQTVSETLPRTVVSVHRIALSGAYSQTSASDITVTLPIEEEYRSYIFFSVYELSDDGSVKLVNGTEIMPDGRSIQFATDELSTYVLCVKAEMEQTDTSDGKYGTILGLELDTKMIRYLIYIGAALFGIIILVVIIAGIRHRRFLNSYNRAYRHSMYRKGVKGIPKGNKMR